MNVLGLLRIANLVVEKRQMRIPYHMLTAAGLALTSNASAVAQSAADGDTERSLLVRVQQIERRIDGLEARQAESSLLLKKLAKRLERPEVDPDERSSPKSEGLRLMGEGVPPTPSPTERWRYKFYQGRWWYLRPNREWLYWSDDRWVPVRPPSPAVAKVGDGAQSFEAEQSMSGSVTADLTGVSSAADGDLHDGLRKIAEAVVGLEKQVRRQAATQAVLIRGHAALMDAYQKQADEALTREQKQRDSVGIENRPRG